MRKGNSTRVDKGLNPGGGGGEREGLKRESRGGNMLGAALGREKISGRLRRGFYCKIHARRGEARARASTQSRLKIHNTRARVCLIPERRGSSPSGA